MIHYDPNSIIMNQNDTRIALGVLAAPERIYLLIYCNTIDCITCQILARFMLIYRRELETYRRYNMNLIRYNPNTVDLLDNVSRWFDDIFIEPSLGNSTLPAVDVRENDSAYLMEVELPGAQRKGRRGQARQHAVDHLLAQGGEQGREEERVRPARAQVRSLQPQLRAARGRRSGEDRCGVQERVLNLTFPKVAAAKPKTIEVKSSEK